MAVFTYRLASCGWNLTVGGGALFLETSVADVKDPAYLVHIERLSLGRHPDRLLPCQGYPTCTWTDA